MSHFRIVWPEVSLQSRDGGDPGALFPNIAGGGSWGAPVLCFLLQGSEADSPLSW